MGRCRAWRTRCFLLVFVLVAAPLAAYIPLAALAAVLAVVAWDMVERPAIRALIGTSRGDAAVLLVTLGLTLFRGLAEAIVVGFALGAVLFIRRMAATWRWRRRRVRLTGPTRAPTLRRWSIALPGRCSSARSRRSRAALDRIGDEHRVLVIDFAGVTLVDSSAANMIEGLAAKACRQGVAVYLTGAAPALRRRLLSHGARPPQVRYAPRSKLALAAARRRGELTQADTAAG